MEFNLSPEETRNAIEMLYSKDVKNVLLGMELIDNLAEHERNRMILTWWDIIFKAYHAYFFNLMLKINGSKERIEVQFPMSSEEEGEKYPNWGIYSTFSHDPGTTWDLYLNYNETRLEIIFDKAMLTRYQIAFEKIIVTDYIKEVKVYVDNHKYIVYRDLTYDDSDKMSIVLKEIWECMIADVKMLLS